MTTSGLTISDSSDNQTLHGGPNDDTITLTHNNGSVHGGKGNDTITSTGSNETIYGDLGVNSITLNGNSNGDVIYGGLGSIVDNSSGTNTLYTYALGTHNVTLGTGHDSVVVRDGTISGHTITTTISGFVSGQDIIDLSLSHGNKTITTSSLSGILSHVADNSSGSAVLTLGSETITFTGVHTSSLHASDFILIA